MSIQKVVDRKNVAAKKNTAKVDRKKEIGNMFRDYVVSQLDELKKVFGCIVIGRDNSDEIVGLSYSLSRLTTGEYYISNSTHNISMTWQGDVFHIGYGANSASYDIKIPFEADMKKQALKRVFKQALETLVSKAYSPYSDYYKSNRKPIAWKMGQGEL